MYKEIFDVLVEVIPSKYNYNVLQGIDSTVITIMHKHGIAMAQCTIENNTDCIYLSNLNVYEIHRRNGIGLELQLIRENIAINLGIQLSSLTVLKDSWMCDWYKRRGYIIYTQCNKYNYMIKKL